MPHPAAGPCKWCAPLGHGHVCHHPNHEAIVRQTAGEAPQLRVAGAKPRKTTPLLTWNAGNKPAAKIAASLEMENIRYLLEMDLVTIGRGADSAIRIPDRSVSWHHAEMLQTSMGTLLYDLASRNGTYVNEKRITAKTLLANGDILRFGGSTPCKYLCHENPPAGKQRKDLI